MPDAVIRITQINTYPIKSCGGLAHESMKLTPHGLRDDRRWMLVHDTDDQRGQFITQRDYPQMASVQPSFVEGGAALALNAPNMPQLCIPTTLSAGTRIQVVIWQETCDALDAGREAAAWFSDYLHTPVRLVWMSEDSVRPVDPRYALAPAQVSFSDGYPLLVISEASLNALNERLLERGKETLPMSRFRPNLVVSGCEAFAEDTWGQMVVGGADGAEAVSFDVVKPCARCKIPSVDQQTGEIRDHQEPLATLATFRRIEGKVMFGQNLIHRGIGTLKVGDVVSVTPKQPIQIAQKS